MDSTTLATRRAIAVNRIVELSTALAHRLELDPALVDALQPTIKDPQVKDLRRLEAIGDVLFALAISAGAIEEPSKPEVVTTVTDVTDVSVPVDEGKGSSAQESSEDELLGAPVPQEPGFVENALTSPVVVEDEQPVEEAVAEEEPTAKTKRKQRGRKG